MSVWVQCAKYLKKVDEVLVQFQFLQMNAIVELQRKGSQLTGDIEDILHAASLNLTAIRTEIEHQSIGTLHEEFSYLQNMFVQIKQLVQDRAPLFMGYLITKQIQDEEGRVRRERLVEYEEKIYDQKRIVTDKQTFFQSLQRPKRKRPSHQTPEEFQEIRAKERENEQKAKFQELVRDITQLHAVKKLLSDQEKGRKKMELQSTKSSSISQVNQTIGQVCEIASERMATPDDRRNKENRPTHLRATSMQLDFAKQNGLGGKQDIEGEQANSRTLLAQIKQHKINNEQLHNMHDQTLLSLRFKKNQLLKLQGIYKERTSQLKQAMQCVASVRKEKEWRRNRVASPVSLRQRQLSR